MCNVWYSYVTLLTVCNLTLHENEVAVGLQKGRKVEKNTFVFLTLIVRSVNTKLGVLAIARPVSIFLCCVMAEKTPRKKLQSILDMLVVVAI